MKPKVFVTRPIPMEAENYLKQHCEYRIWSGNQRINREQLLNEVKDAEGLLTIGDKIDNGLLDAAPNLRIVSNVAVGYNNFDIRVMKARNVLGTHTPYVVDETVADLIMALILSSARRITELDKFVREGLWKQGQDEEMLFGVDVHHSTLGIIGMGRIGEALARRAKLGFNMKVMYHNRTRKPATEQNLGVEYSTMELLLQSSDHVVLMTPLTPETIHLMNYKQFQLMKNDAFFINASRGETVNEEALIEALLNKKIRGAGLDVYKQEPVNPVNPLLQMPNVVTLPHIGAGTHKTRFNMMMMAVENLIIGLQGQLPPCLVPELK